MLPIDVAFGGIADIAIPGCHVRFAPDNGHCRENGPSQLAVYEGDKVGRFAAGARQRVTLSDGRTAWRVRRYQGVTL